MKFSNRWPLLALALFFTFFFWSCEKEDPVPLICSQCEECGLDPDPGPCEAYFPKYYYDKEEGKCKQFIWGGCNGTVPFDTLEACEACGCNN